MGDSENAEIPKELTENRMETKEIVKAVCVAAAVAFGGWCISKVFFGSGKALFGSAARKLMKAPGRNYYIYRDVFEADPASYFRSLRNGN